MSPHRKLSKKDSKDKFIDQLINMAKYEKMNKSEKIQYLEALIAVKEDELRKKTDRVLEGGDAFDLVLSNQRYFAVSQDKYASKAKE